MLLLFGLDVRPLTTAVIAVLFVALFVAVLFEAPRTFLLEEVFFPVVDVLAGLLLIIIDSLGGIKVAVLFVLACMLLLLSCL